MLLSRILHPRRTPLPECLTCVICLRGLTEFDFLQEMRLGRRCLYVLIEILSVQCLPFCAPKVCDLRRQALRPQASFGCIYSMVPLPFSFCVSHLCSGSLPSGPSVPLTDNLRKGFGVSLHSAPSSLPSTLVSGLDPCKVVLGKTSKHEYIILY